MNSDEPNQSATIGIASILAVVAAGAYITIEGVSTNVLLIVLASGIVAAWFGLGIAVMARGLIEHHAADVAYGFAASASAIIVPYLLLIVGLFNLATR